MDTASISYDTIFSELESDFTPQAAEGVLSLDFSQRQRDRMDELAAKARDGELTDDERSEAESYERAGAILSILQSRARMALRHVAT